jgi:hypothetical protein
MVEPYNSVTLTRNPAEPIPFNGLAPDSLGNHLGDSAR